MAYNSINCQNSVKFDGTAGTTPYYYPAPAMGVTTPNRPYYETIAKLDFVDTSAKTVFEVTAIVPTPLGNPTTCRKTKIGVPKTLASTDSCFNKFLGTGVVASGSIPNALEWKAGIGGYQGPTGSLRDPYPGTLLKPFIVDSANGWRTGN
jgi:hypothetical protein